MHAVVATHMVTNPLTPTLYTQPIVPPPIESWTESGVWLHKPPLTFWLIAVSLATFGTHAIALRLPSLLLSTMAVVVTFLIGRRVFDARIGLLAAAFQAVNGLLVAHSSGRRVADHVDTVLLTCVELGVLAIVTGLDDRRAVRSAWLAGVALGLGILTKSFPALIVAAVAAAAWQEAFGFRRAAGLLSRLLTAAALVCGPWLVVREDSLSRRGDRGHPLYLAARDHGDRRTPGVDLGVPGRDAALFWRARHTAGPGGS